MIWIGIAIGIAIGVLGTIILTAISNKILLDNLPTFYHKRLSREEQEKFLDESLNSTIESIDKIRDTLKPSEHKARGIYKSLR